MTHTAYEIGSSPVSIDALVEQHSVQLQNTVPGTSEHRTALRHYFVGVVAQQFPGLFSEVEYESERSTSERIQNALEVGLEGAPNSQQLLGFQRNWNLFFIRQISARIQYSGEPPRNFSELLFRLEGIHGEKPTVWFKP